MGMVWKISRHEYILLKKKMRNSQKIHAREKYMLYSNLFLGVSC